MIKQKRQPPWRNRTSTKPYPMCYREPIVYELKQVRLKFYLYRYKLAKLNQKYKIGYNTARKKRHFYLKYKNYEDKQIIKFCAWYNNIVDKFIWYVRSECIEVFMEIYKDRNERYDLYFTQGITDPFGPEANTYMALTSNNDNE